MADFDLTTASGQQDFQNWTIRTIQNEMQSYTRSVLNTGNANTSNASTGVSSSATSSANNMLIPTGVIVPYAGGTGVTTAGTIATIPDGWLLCDGTFLNRSTYSGLFTIIGTMYNVGDNSTTFGIPDLRGRIIAGTDTSGLVDPNANSQRLRPVYVTAATLGSVIGDARLQAHTHTGSTGKAYTDSGPTNLLLASNAGAYIYETVNQVGNTTASQKHQHDFTTNTHNQNQGGGQNIQPTMMINYIIKT